MLGGIFDFVAIEFESLGIVTLLVSWVMKVEYSEGFKFQLLNFSLNNNSNEGIFKNALARSGLLLQAAYGVTIQYLTAFCCYGSLDKGSLDRGTHLLESLLSKDDVHYMLSSLKH